MARSTLKQIYDTLYFGSITNPNDRDFQNSDKDTVHSYIGYYERALSQYRDRDVRVMEIGVQGGISLLMWRKYFEKGEITGIDIDYSRIQKKVVDDANSSGKIVLIKEDAASPRILKSVSGKYDIIIDDGSHQFAHQLTTFMLLKDLLAEGGIYIIEDLQSEEEARLLNRLVPNSQLVDLRHIKNRYDDLVLEYKKPS